MYIYIYIHIHVYILLSLSLSIYIYIYIHTYTHIHTYIHTYRQTDIHTHIHTYEHTHTYACTCACTCTDLHTWKAFATVPSTLSAEPFQGEEASKVSVPRIGEELREEPFGWRGLRVSGSFEGSLKGSRVQG